MSTGLIFRGTLVAFATTFVDANNSPVFPASARMFLTYPRASAENLKVELPVTNDAGTFRAEWDSSVSAAGIVYWSVRSDNPDIAQDGSFTLSANAANPPPA